MRRWLRDGRFYFLLAILILGIMLTWEMTKPFEADNSAESVVICLDNNGFTDATQGKGEPTNRIFIRSGLVPPVGQWLLLGRQLLPAWSRMIVSRTMIMTGFFSAALVILLFFAFYQSSRGSKDEADGGSFALRALKGC